MQLAVDALKAAPPNPDYLDMRDMILQADMVNNGGVNQCVLWNAFARMGMGDSATTTGDIDINPVEAFDLPAACIPDIGVDADLSFDNVCLGENPLNQFRINNTGSGDLIVRSVTKVSGSSDITLSAVPEAPLVVEPAGYVDFSVTCGPTSCGTTGADIRIESDDPDQPVITLTYTCDTDWDDPSFTSVPSDIAIECDLLPDPAITGTPTVVDNCDGSPDLTFTDSVTPGDCPQESTILRTWTVTDTCGNSVSHEQTIEVVDTIPPDIECNAPPTITPPDAPISFTASATDNCDDGPVISEIISYNCFEFTNKGKSIDKTESCIVEVDGDTITVVDSGGVGDNITWSIRANDSCGNVSESTCSIMVVNPRQN
jgi:hypothetical protein